MPKTKKSNIGVREVKSRMVGRWREFFSSLGDIAPTLLDAKGHPCPKCGGTDRFSVFADFDTTGGMMCRKCFTTKNQDGIAAIQFLRGCDFQTALALIADYLGISGTPRSVTSASVLAAICQQKSMPVESAHAFGARIERNSVIFPAYDEYGKQCTTFQISLVSGRASKGKYESEKPAGIFLPYELDVPRLPRSGDSVIVAHSMKDAIALHGLGYYAIGLPGCELSAKFIRLFRGCNVTIIPHRNSLEYERCVRNCQRLAGTASSVKRVDLPLAMDGEEGDDCRDVLAKKDGMQLLRVAIADALVVSKGTSSAVDMIEFTRITSRDLDTSDFSLSYLVEGVLVEGQPCLASGPHKSLKTTIACVDLGISLATATPFLGQFNVPAKVAVGILSGESGMASLQATARRVAKTRNIELREIESLVWTPDLPIFGDDRYMDALRRFIDRDRLKVVIIDPAYLCAPLAAEKANNLFAMGELLRSVNDACTSCGTTLVIVHHMRKTGKNYDPPQLGDTAWSGWSEWARQWLLLNRRQPFDPDSDGTHKLWFLAGGSAGHSGVWGLDVTEGRQSDPDGRKWEVIVRSMTDLRADAKSRKDSTRNATQQAKREADVARLLQVLASYPEGASNTVLREKCGLSGTKYRRLIVELVNRDSAEPCTVIIGKRRRSVEGFRPVIGNV